MFFTRRSGQRIGTRLIFYRKVRPGSELHRPNTEASQIAEVHLADCILQDEGRVRDGKHIVGEGVAATSNRKPPVRDWSPTGAAL